MKKTPDEYKMNKIQEVLRRLGEVEVSSSAREKFVSRLAQIEQPKTALERMRVFMTRLVFGLEEAAYGLRTALAAPRYAYARIVVLMFITISIYAYGFLPQEPMIHAVNGTVKVYRGGGDRWVLASNRMRIGKNDIVKTFDDGRVDISLKGVYSIRLKKDTEVKLASLSARATNAPITFDVSKGKALTYYAGYKSGSYKKLDIRTEELVATAIGTNFVVEAMPVFRKSWVGVLDGAVMVRSAEISPDVDEAEAAVIVNSRHMTEVSEGKTPTKPKMIPEDEWLQLEELYSVGKKPQVALLISTGPSRTRELLSMAPLFISDEKPSILPEKLKEAAKLFNQAIKEQSTDKHARAIGIFEEIVDKHPDPKYDIQFMLFIGAYYEYMDLHKKAISEFENVLTRYPQSSLASIAQLAIGYIYEEKLDEPKRAKEAYLKILSDYPNSPEAEKALAGLHRLSKIN